LGAAESLETIFDYFASQLLNHVPAKVRDVLMKCALFQSMSAGLAAAITDEPDAGDILEHMYRRHLFVDRRFETEVLYQFHALFRAFLLYRLKHSVGAEHRMALTRRAANLIQSEGRTDEAMTLFIQARDWTAATELVLREAPVVLGQGRNRTLREWLEAMPESWFGEHPWLAYWLGQSWLPENLRAARAAFERSYAGQRSVGDIGGQILAIAGIMETHYFLWSQFSALDPWIAEICDLLDKSPAFANAEMELRVYGVLLMATHHRAPRSPWLCRAVERIRALLSANLSDDWKVRAGNMLLGYAHAASNLPLGCWVVEAIGPIVQGGKVSPLARCMWLGRMGLHLAHKGRYEEAIAAVDQADALARDQGIGADAAVRAFWGVLATMNGGDLPRAEAFVSRLEAIARRDRPAEVAMAHYCRCMLALAIEDRTAALEHGRSAVRIASAEGAFWLQVNSIGVAIYAMIDAGELDDAASYMRELRSLVKGTFLAAFEVEVDLCEAALALASQDRSATHRHIHRACQTARSRGYLFFHRAMPRPLRRVLSEALQAEVESEYFREIIRRFGLWPGPDGDDNWPWPLRLRVLGSFELLLDGAPPIFSRKLPRKTLALLCVIIALGGTDVAEQHVIDALWPEDEGDVAYRSLAASVRRLRELLGRRGAIRHSGGRLSLATHGLWLDAWALEKALEADANPALAIRLYRGPFLPGEDAPWAAPMRERLRMKFLRAVHAVGSQHEQTGRLEDAADTYERALNADNTAEPLYQGLMRCYGLLERPAEVARVYQRLRQALATSARTPPSAASEQLYRHFSLPKSVNTTGL
jgi:DNA-binding SARP family transcriptional activator